MQIIKKLKIFIIGLLFINNLSYAEDVSCNCKSYADVVKPLLPAVVNISVSSKNHATKQMTPFPEGSPLEEFNRFFERFENVPDEFEEDNSPLKPTAAGSGFLISADGYIVTNYHVVEEAQKITITFSDEKKLDAILIGYDNRTDLALLKVDSNYPLPFVKFGNSDESRVGDKIIAIGNPFGLGGTVTTGIISSQTRDISSNPANIIDNFIQTDAAINRGNSGGPMFNMDGEVIGINFAIVSPTGTNIGLGFAVPSSIAKPVVEQLKKDGKIHRGWIGLSIKPTDEISESLGLKEGVGSLVINVAKDSPAEKAGIKPGDIVLKFDGKEISNYKKLSRIVAETAVGKKVNMELMSNGKTKNISVIVGEFNSNKEDINAKTNNKKLMYGMNLSALSPKNRQNYNITNNIEGIIVTFVDRRSTAAKHGIRVGDVIVSANQKILKTPEDLNAIIEEAKKNQRKSIMLLINRAGGNAFLSLPVISANTLKANKAEEQ